MNKRNKAAATRCFLATPQNVDIKNLKCIQDFRHGLFFFNVTTTSNVLHYAPHGRTEIANPRDVGNH